MSGNSSIEWTDATWNPVRGCSIVSKGCTNCYAMKFAHRFSGPGKAFAGLTTLSKGGPVWNGKIKLVPEMLDQPMRWKQPRRIFVNSMSDLFHEDIPDEFIDRVFAVMALSPQHTFQILTKRPGRMKEWFEERWQGTPAQRIEFEGLPPLDIPAGGETGREGQVEEACEEFLQAFKLADPGKKHLWTPEGSCKAMQWKWPLPNVWLGVSVEDQKTADERIPLLLQTPAAVRWISAEPLLGPVSFRWAKWHNYYPEGWRERGESQGHLDGMKGIDWIVVGGESGPGARPMNPEWPRAIRDQCVAAGVPFFFKQWGGWAPEIVSAGGNLGGDMRAGRVRHVCADRENDGHFRRGDAYMRHVGKNESGRILDGRTWDEYPK